MGERPGDGRLPDFIVAGAARSGTTSIARYLGAHPELWMSPVKEIRFFNKHYEQGTDWYRQQFADAPSDALAGEATPAYFANVAAMRRMASDIPDVKLILSFREPVDRLWSQHWMRRSISLEGTDFEGTVTREMEAYQKEGPDSPMVGHLTGSLYGHHVERLYKLFPKEQVHVQIFERMTDSPAEGYAAMCSFLGVDEGFRPDNLGVVVNAHTSFRSVKLRNLAKSSGSRTIKRLIGKLNSKPGAHYPELDPELAASLRRFFAPDVKKLEELLDTRIDEWRT